MEAIFHVRDITRRWIQEIGGRWTRLPLEVLTLSSTPEKEEDANVDWRERRRMEVGVVNFH